MSEYKLVPVEPTEEMIKAAREQHEGDAYLPVSLYRAMLDAAPAVQGEPVGWLNIVSLPHAPDEDQVFWFARSDGCIEGPREIQQGGYDYEEFEFYCPAVPPSLYIAPQPAEQSACPVCHGEGLRLNPLTEVPVLCENCNGGQQPECGCCGQTDRCDDDCDAVDIGGHRAAEQQPDDSADVRLDKQCRQDVAAALGFPCGGNYAWSYLLQQIKDAASAAEQQPEPDVEALVEALEGIMRVEARNRMMPVGAEWDAARAALAVHRKQRGNP